MKGYINLKDTIHSFEKVDLVGDNDFYRCTKCGIEGVHSTFQDELKTKNCKKELFENCKQTL